MCMLRYHWLAEWNSLQVPQKRTSTSTAPPPSPPPFSPPSSDSATPGKSNLKQNSQFQKPSPETTSAGDHVLPEIPTIEIHSVNDAEETATGAGTKGTKAAGKGVRFADEEEQANGSEQQTAVQSNSVAVDITDIGIKLQNEEDEKTGGEAIEMDSVDFDKVTGTSTPISDDSPSLPTKHSSTVDDSRHFMANATSDSSVEHEDKEEVIIAAENKNHDGATTETPSNSRAAEEGEGSRAHEHTNVQESLAQVDSIDQSQL